MLPIRPTWERLREACREPFAPRSPPPSPAGPPQRVCCPPPARTSFRQTTLSPMCASTVNVASSPHLLWSNTPLAWLLRNPKTICSPNPATRIVQNHPNHRQNKPETHFYLCYNSATPLLHATPHPLTLSPTYPFTPPSVVSSCLRGGAFLPTNHSPLSTHHFPHRPIRRFPGVFPTAA
jgi:hypothetical protein